MKLLKLRHIPDFKFDIYLPCNEGRGGRSIGADPLLQYFGKKIENGVTWCRLQLWCFCFCLCQEEVAQAEARPDTCVSQHRREVHCCIAFSFSIQLNGSPWPLLFFLFPLEKWPGICICLFARNLKHSTCRRPCFFKSFCLSHWYTVLKKSAFYWLLKSHPAHRYSFEYL